MNGISPIRFAREMAACTMRREGLLRKRWSYDYGVVWRGMEMLHELTGEQAYFDYVKDGMDTFIDAKGGIRDYTYDSFNLDYVCNGKQLLFLYQKTGDTRYRAAADTLRRQLRQQPRTPDGGFWHKKCYPEQMWLDGLHMATPFYLEYALTTGEGAESINDAIRQLCLAYEHTYDEKTGLNRHAWDAAKAQPWADPATGQAAHAWGRAMGWYMVALVDSLAMLPRDAKDYAALLAILQKMSQTLLAVRRNGVWTQVLDCPDRVGNYEESSCSCMFVYALLKASRLGWIPGEMGDEALKSFDALVKHFVGRMRDGTVFLMKCCQGAGLGGDQRRDGSYDYYISEPIISFDLKGTGAFLQAACEAERAMK